MAKYAVGQRIYNHGDQANPPHFGVITQVEQGSGSSSQYLIKPDKGSSREPYWIGEYMFSPVFKGHSGTRIVTEEAYKAWRKNQLAQLGIKTDSAIKKFIVKDNKIYKLKNVVKRIKDWSSSEKLGNGKYIVKTNGKKFDVQWNRGSEIKISGNPSVEDIRAVVYQLQHHGLGSRHSPVIANGVNFKWNREFGMFNMVKDR